MSVFIGIDPDRCKSGVALYRAEGSRQSFFNSSEVYPSLELFNFNFFDLFDFLRTRNFDKVFIEAGWLNKGVWSIANRNTGDRKIQAKIAHDIGANHEAGKKIVEMCEYLGLKYELVKPSTAKLDHKTFVSLTKWSKRTNEEQRDAAMLVFGRK